MSFKRATAALCAVFICVQGIQAGDIFNYFLQPGGMVLVTTTSNRYQPLRSAVVATAGSITDSEGVRGFSLSADIEDDGLFRNANGVFVQSDLHFRLLFSGWEVIAGGDGDYDLSAYAFLNNEGVPVTLRIREHPLISADGTKLTLVFDIIGSTFRPLVHYVVELNLRKDFVVGDTNSDCRVDIADLNAVRNDFGKTGPGVAGDVDGNQQVDIADLNAVRNDFGKSCEAGAELIMQYRQTKSRVLKKLSTAKSGELK